MVLTHSLYIHGFWNVWMNDLKASWRRFWERDRLGHRILQVNRLLNFTFEILFPDYLILLVGS